MDSTAKAIKTRVLIVEDEDDLRDTLCRYFAHVGLDVVGFGDVESVPADLVGFDVIVCDINLPGESGFSLAARLHQTTMIGIILLTARGDVEDRVMGLSLGADDYLVKPVDLRELELRIRTLAKRVRTGEHLQAATLPTHHAAVAGSSAWGFCLKTWRLLPPGATEGVSLTAAEYHLLGKLTEQAGEPVPRDALLEAVGNAPLPDYGRNLDVAVSRLRRKIRKACGLQVPISSVRGVGYVFAAPAEQM